MKKLILIAGVIDIAEHKCSLQLYGSGFPSEERMEKLRKRDGIEPGRETWSQSH